MYSLEHESVPNCYVYENREAIVWQIREIITRYLALIEMPMMPHLRRHIDSWRKSIILIQIRAMQRLKLNSKRHQKPMLYLVTLKREDSMTSLVMLHLRQVVPEQVDLNLILVIWVISSICLEISLVAEALVVGQTMDQ